tara:strand:- start:470 stop:649 length:180 start_codon:yes stop_codon:yes gene_type:complete
MDWTEALDLINKINIVSNGLRYTIVYKDLDTLNKILWNVQTSLDVLQEMVDDELSNNER